MPIKLPFTTLVINFFRHAGQILLLAGRTFRAAFRRPFPTAQVIEQMDVLGVQSLLVLVLTGLFTGLVLGVQGINTLQPFGGMMVIGNAVSSTLNRELGPVLAGLMVTARVGAGIASEIGSMTATNQIDALRVFGADPNQYLVLPRLIAMMVTMPLMVAITCLVGLIGGHIVVVYDVGYSSLFYWGQVAESLRAVDIAAGMTKAIAYSWVIVFISCHMGLTTRGGTEAVGRSTTEAVVYGSVALLVVNFLLTTAFYGQY